VKLFAKLPERKYHLYCGPLRPQAGQIPAPPPIISIS